MAPYRTIKLKPPWEKRAKTGRIRADGVLIIYINSGYLDGGLPGMSEKKGRRIWSKRVTWVLLHAVHFFQTYREVGELEIALSFALLQMSWGR